jgi:hypothetical protein
VLVENEILAKQLEGIFATQTSGQRAWQVTLNGKKLQWSDGTETFDNDPKASAGRHLQAWLAKVLHLDAQLLIASAEERNKGLVRMLLIPDTSAEVFCGRSAAAI